MQEKVIKERQERLINWGRQEGIATLWISMPPNRTYLSGYKADDGPFMESSGWIFCSEGNLYLLVDHRYTTEARREALNVEIIGAPNLWKAFEEVVPRLDMRNLGYEEEYVTVGQLNRLLTVLRERDIKPELVPIDMQLSSMREQKDPFEVEVLREGANILSRIMEELSPDLKEGVSERELAHRVRELALGLGAEDLAFQPIVASGPNSALPHARPSDRTLRAGDAVVVDIGIRYMSYMTDMTRTFFVGEPDPVLKEIYKAVAYVQKMVLSSLGPGISGKEADGLARNSFREMGYIDYFSHGLGHGIGLAVHESPRLGPTSNDILKESSVFTVEPGLYLPDKGGVRIEDMVLLKEGVLEVLTRGVCIYEF